MIYNIFFWLNYDSPAQKYASQCPVRQMASPCLVTGEHRGNTLKKHQCYHHNVYRHASLGAAAPAFCENSWWFIFKAKLLITIGGELANRGCGFYASSPVWMGLPCDKVVHHSSVFSLLTLADTSNDSRVIRKLLKMARLCLVTEVRGVKGEEEKRVDSPLWGPGVAEHCIWHTVPQVHVLWSASEVIHNPGHKGGIHQHHRQFVIQ